MNQSEPHQPQGSFVDRMRSTMNIVAMVVSVFTAFAEVTFFRTRFGERYFQGWKTALVIPLLILFPVFFPYDDPRPLWLCLLLYLIMCARHRMSILRRRSRGETGVHSYYNGVSRLEKRHPHISELTLKSRHEPALMLLMAIGAMVISPPMGVFFFCCGLSMAIHASLLIAHQRERSLDLSDAKVEGRLLVESSREPAHKPTTPTSDAVVRVHRSVLPQERSDS